MNDADYHKYFTFTIELKDAAGNPLTEEFAYYFYGADKAGYVSNGDKFILHHDEALTILGLPAGAQFKITEQLEQDSGWYVNPVSGIVTGIITEGETMAAAFVNAKSPQQPDKPTTDPDDPDNPDPPPTDPDNPDNPDPPPTDPDNPDNPDPPPTDPDEPDNPPSSPPPHSPSKITHPDPPSPIPPIEPPVETMEPSTDPPVEFAQLPETSTAMPPIMPEEDPLIDLDPSGIPRHFLLTEQELAMNDAALKSGTRDLGTPETSDNSKPGLWVLLNILSLCGLAVLCLIKYHKDKKAG